jgi:ppGpp synthetase/RelA/SpoT-type nucleotidyltranferase
VRLVEDLLRAEYFGLLARMQRTLTALQTEVNYLLLPSQLKLNSYARILVRGRVKDCESAVDSLRRRQEGGTFDSSQPDKYTLTALPDLVGIRILTFPQPCFDEASEIVTKRIPDWVSDHIEADDPSARPIALKFHGLWHQDDPFRSEIQIVSLLIGLFWEVEHSAIYKPAPNLRGVARSLAMKSRTVAVLASLRAFEQEFGSLIENDSEKSLG